MIAALLPLLAAPAAPLALKIESPRTAPSGEAVPVKVWLVNTSKAPVVVVAPSPVNYELGVKFDGDLWRGDGRVATNWTGKWFGQWMRAHQYDPSAFVTIAPGARIAVEDAKYQTEYLSGRRPGLISEVSSAPHQDLVPGEYTYWVTWSFKPMLEQNNAGIRAGIRAGKPTAAWPVQTLSPAAKRLYRQAWRGELAAECPLTIQAK